MVKHAKDELVVVGFNYDLLEAKVAEQVHSSADRIRAKVKKTVEDIIDVGNDLLAVKAALPHGNFGPWLPARIWPVGTHGPELHERGREVQIGNNCRFADPAECRLPPFRSHCSR